MLRELAKQMALKQHFTIGYIQGCLGAMKAISDLKHILHSTHTLLPNHKAFRKWAFEKYCDIILIYSLRPGDHICVNKIAIISSDNGLSPGRRQVIIRTNAEILWIRTSGTNVSEILKEIYTFSFKKMHLNMSSGKWRPFCFGLNVLRTVTRATRACNIRSSATSENRNPRRINDKAELNHWVINKL